MALVIPSIPTLTSFLPDSTAVYTQDYIQVFRNARPILAKVALDSELMRQPLETGETTIDHRIYLPTKIELSLILNRNDYFNTYQEIEQLYSSSTLLIVQTKASVYSNQLIRAIPHEENPDMFNTFTVILQLEEVLFSNPPVDTVVPRNPTNANTINRGNIQPQPATGKKILVEDLVNKELKEINGG